MAKKCRTRTWLVHDTAARFWRGWSIERLSDCRMHYPSLYTDVGGYCVRCGHTITKETE